MLNVIIKAVFYIVGKLGDIILTPIVAGISILFPDFSTLFTSFLKFINDYILIALPWAFKFFCVPKLCIDVIITIATASVAIMVIVRTYVLIVRIYNKFKP